MRKLLAMVATMAMVLSMFAGIAFATAEAVHISLDEKTFAEATEAKEVYLEGQILDEDDEIVEDDFFVQIIDDEDAVKAVGLAVDGVFKIDLNGLGVDEYTVILVGFDTNDYSFNLANAPTFHITPEVSYTGDLSFTWGQTGTVKYVGVATGITGPVRLVDVNGDQIGGTFAVNSGYFAVSVDRDLFLATGNIYLLDDDDKVIAIGKVSKGDFSDELSVNVDSVAYGLPGREVKVEIDTDDLEFGDNDPADVRYNFYVENEDGDEIVEVEGVTLSDGARVLTFTAERADRGTATITVEMVNEDDDVLYEGEVTFEIVRPSSVTWVGLPKDNTLQLSSRSWDFSPEAYYGSNYSVAPYYVISATGDAKLSKTTIEDGESVTIKLTKTGSFELTVKAYDGDPADDGELIDEKTFTITIVGGSMTIEPTNLQYDQDQDVVITVMDKNGNPVNNAYIYFLTEADAYVNGVLRSSRNPVRNNATFAILPTDVNANNGVYAVELDEDDALLAAPGKFVAFAFQGNSADATLLATTELKVLGDNVYDVFIDEDEDVLGGLDTDLVVTVTEDDADVKSLANANFVLVYDDEEITDAVTIKSRTGGEYKITVDGEELVEAGQYTLRIEKGTKYGEATFEVVMPEIVVEGGKVTNLYESELTVKVIDPRDGSELDWNIYVVGEYADVLELESGSYGVDEVDDGEFEIIGSEDGIVITILAEADYDTAEDEEEVAGVLISVVSPDDVEIDVDCLVEIADATLTATPAAPVIGLPTAVTFQLTDANGNGIKGYNVKRGDTTIGKTNDDGKVTYTTTLYDMVRFSVTLNSDKSETIEVTVTPGMDTEAPVISYPETTEEATATITVTDNVRITRIRINGVEDKDFFPGQTYTWNVDLVMGANTFTVEALDANYNTTGVQTVTITRVASSDKVVLQGDAVQRQGEYLYVQLRQFEEMGATFGWNDATKTATFVLDGKTVAVTVGSTTAVVDGENATMPVAPFIVDGRTFVPTRFVAEALGMGVHWQAGDIVTITK